MDFLSFHDDDDDDGDDGGQLKRFNNFPQIDLWFLFSKADEMLDDLICFTQKIQLATDSR